MQNKFILLKYYKTLQVLIKIYKNKNVRLKIKIEIFFR